MYNPSTAWNGGSFGIGAQANAPGSAGVVDCGTVAGSGIEVLLTNELTPLETGTTVISNGPVDDGSVASTEDKDENCRGKEEHIFHGIHFLLKYYHTLFEHSWHLWLQHPIQFLTEQLSAGSEPFAHRASSGAWRKTARKRKTPVTAIDATRHFAQNTSKQFLTASCLENKLFEVQAFAHKAFQMLQRCNKNLLLSKRLSSYHDLNDKVT